MRHSSQPGRVTMCRRLAIIGALATVIGACSEDEGRVATPTTTSVVVDIASSPVESTAAGDPGDATSTTDTATTPIGTDGVPESSSSAPPAADSTPDHFDTLPVGSVLPTDAVCAGEVRPAEEIKDVNTPFNERRGVVSADSAPPVVGQPVTGDFTGTTDEIIQWTACKWGIDEDIVRAQMAKETGWRMNFQGDFTPDQANCHVSVRTTDGSDCPEALGISQIRPQYHPKAFVNDNAVLSTAYNLDYAYSVWRSCYEGLETWLNDAERGEDYASGDVWGCVGLWFSGRWHTEAAETYIDAVQDYLDDRVWESGDFPDW